MENARFVVDKEKCIHCGKCLRVCPGNLVGGETLNMKDGYPEITSQTKFGWHGCWKCERCFAVCPVGAISIFGLKSDNKKVEKPSDNIKDDLPKLVRFRRSCRNFKGEDVDKNTILEIMDAMGSIPTGGNNTSLEFSVVSNRNGMKKLYDAIFGKDVQLSLFGDEKEDFSKLALYNAPCCFIAHKSTKTNFKKGMMTELGMSIAYFELLANAYGLGTIITNQTALLISKSKAARSILNIPQDHEILAVVGFGYPIISYARGVEKHKRTTYLN